MKQKKGGGLFLFTHLTVERCPFLFIYHETKNKLISEKVSAEECKRCPDRVVDNFVASRGV